MKAGVALSIGLCILSFAGGMELVKSEAKRVLWESKSIARENKSLQGGLVYCTESLEVLERERMERERTYAHCVVEYERLLTAVSGEPVEATMFMSYTEAYKLFVDLWFGRPLDRGLAAMEKEGKLKWNNKKR